MRGHKTEWLDAVSHRPAEYAWIKTCKLRDAVRGQPQRPVMGQLEHFTLSALDHCLFLGWITPGGFAVLVRYGATGPPDRTDTKARQEWDGAIDVLETEMNRRVFPPPTPLDRHPTFFWGVGGVPFVDAANAWWWTLDCLEARATGARDTWTLRTGRPCEPDDVVNVMRRLDLSPTHARTVMSWGKKGDEPPKGTAARQYWDEVMRLLTPILQAKGIVRPAMPADLEVIDAMAKLMSPELSVPETVEQDTPRKRRAVG